MPIEKVVFFISDRTGLTAESIGHSLLTQFDEIQFRRIALRFIDTEKRAKEVILQVNAIPNAIIFSTIVNEKIRKLIRAACPVLMYDLFDAFIEPMEKELGRTCNHKSGLSHGMGDKSSYDHRIDAINFAQTTDDGLSTRYYQQAELILLGVSRVGKTPSAFYLAQQWGKYVANYPFVDEDLENNILPQLLLDNKDKCYGLTIQPQRLSAIRQMRRPHSRYAEIGVCRTEIKHSEALFKHYQIPFIDVSNQSIEEIATIILSK